MSQERNLAFQVDLVRVGAIYNVASVGWRTGEKEFHFTQIEETAVYRNCFPESTQTGQNSLKLDPNFCSHSAQELPWQEALAKLF